MLLFFLCLRRPPTSTLFPYTTLFRSLTVNGLVAATHLLVPIQAAYFAIEGTDDLLETYERIRARPNPDLKVLGVVITRSEEHTSELQSRGHLVCRLLLEKKKKT